MINYHRFNLIFFTITLLPLFSIGVFNFFIDPYGVFNSPVISGINQTKPSKFTHDLLFKAVEIIRLKPTTVLLGSSRVQWGLGPTHPGLSKQKTSYNLGLQGTNVYEVMRHFQHALTN